MRFNIYNRFQLEIVREGAAWACYQGGAGKRVRAAGLVIPSELTAGELAEYLDDIYHELARPGDTISVLA
ncbi:hypothetical protein [Achromobacter sp. UMC71]|uniref:DUF7661 family protein n=1 Tax=Achromobacter sp. UMC71 TaxID=1862320 RepID=UPI00160282BF|nr:hypothetical protein [Achromobacter sp. UMC71]MBB1626396.1 hypothetical protein [Achromobacter sp. UMC71]